MKRKLVTFATATLFLLGALFITSCGNDQNTENKEEIQNIEADENEQVKEENMDENTKTEQIAAAYVCPMHPEETGNEGDKCSKCGMPLEKASEATEEDHSGHDHD